MCIFDQNINMTETINLHKYFYYAFGSSQHMQYTDNKSRIIFDRPNFRSYPTYLNKQLLYTLLRGLRQKISVR